MILARRCITRTARYIQCIAVLLAAGRLATAQTTTAPAAAVIAQGTITLVGPHGAETGAITISTAGENYCRVVIELGPAVLHRQYVAVLSGSRGRITGPADLVQSVPLPVSPRLGCALLPQGVAIDRLAAGGATLSTDSAGRPLSLSWSERGKAAALTYAGYSVAGGAAEAATVTEDIAGKPVLGAHFSSFSSKAFSPKDFALPPLPGAPAPGPAQGPSGGAQ